MTDAERDLERCQWPGCYSEALCSSGNVAGALVCREHFKVTNGKADSELSPDERAAMLKMVQKDEAEK